MIKKLILGTTATGLVLAGAASAAQLTTSGVDGQTLAAGDVTVNGAVLEDISFGTAWTQDFTTGTDGLAPNGAGSVTHSNGEGTVTGSVFTRFGGYTTTSTAPWTASVDVHLDPSSPRQFDYTVAANDAGGHVQDFIFHAATTGGKLNIGASNNSNAAPKPVANGYPVTEAGWYTLQHEFRADANGNLVVDMSVIKDGESVWSVEKEAKDNGQPVVFADTGHRYGWFTFTDGQLKIDNLSLTSAEPQSQVENITVDVDKANAYVVASIGSFTSAPVKANADGVAVIDIPTTSVEDFQGPIHLIVTS